MKTNVSFLLLFVLFSAFQCEQGENLEPRQELVGKWKLVKYYLSTGGPGYWTDADPANLSIIEFKANGAYSNNSENDCSGLYTAATDQEIIIKVSCSTGYVQQSDLAGKILETGELSLTPTMPICIEGCASIYKGIK